MAKTIISALKKLGLHPNHITVGRLVFLIPGMYLWHFQNKIALQWYLHWQSVGIMAIILITIAILGDLLDGWYARKSGQVSETGKKIDPLIDKIITYSLLYILFGNVVNYFVLGIMFVLDVISTTLRSIKTEGANFYGKYKSVIQNLAILLFGLAVLLSISSLNIIGNLLLCAAIILAGISVGLRLIQIEKIRFLIPQFFTLCNLIAGLSVIFFSYHKEWEIAFINLYLAMILDTLDGPLARKLEVKSNFGAKFDSFSDFISFGVAPYFVCICMFDWNPFVIVLGLIYPINTYLRLGDYKNNKHITPPGFFRGLPCPAAAWLVIGLQSIFPNNYGIGLLIGSILMVKFNIHYPKFTNAFTCKSGQIQILFSMIFGGIMAWGTNSLLNFFVFPIVFYLFTPLWRKLQKTTAT